LNGPADGFLDVRSKCTAFWDPDTLKTTGLRLAFVFNFNVDVLMKGGFDRVVL
jgi:hypothetical protein